MYYHHSEIPSEEAHTPPWWGYENKAFSLAARLGMLNFFQQHFPCGVKGCHGCRIGFAAVDLVSPGLQTAPERVTTFPDCRQTGLRSGMAGVSEFQEHVTERPGRAKMTDFNLT